MKIALLITGHSQKEEWEISADFFKTFDEKSFLKNADILACVNCKDIKASQIERYLERYPQKNKYLFYTPLNGHSVTQLTLDSNSTNLYKTDYNINREGYLFGILETYANTFDLLKSYDYVLQINADVYVTNPKKLENYMIENFDSDVIFHMNTMREDINKGFSCDSIIYRPNLMADNLFLLYRHPQLLNEVMQRRQTDPNYRFLPEQLLKHIIISTNSKHTIMCPGTRNNRKIDAFGLWHCHDVNESRKILNEIKNT